MNSYFTNEIPHCLDLFGRQMPRSIPNTKNKPLSSTFCRRRRTWSFHVVVLQWTALKCTMIYNTHAHLLFSSLNLLFNEGHVAIVVVVCLSSLLTKAFHIYSELNPTVLILSLLVGICYDEPFICFLCCNTYETTD